MAGSPPSPIALRRLASPDCSPSTASLVNTSAPTAVTRDPLSPWDTRLTHSPPNALLPCFYKLLIKQCQPGEHVSISHRVCHISPPLPWPLPPRHAMPRPSRPPIFGSPCLSKLLLKQRQPGEHVSIRHRVCDVTSSQQTRCNTIDQPAGSTHVTKPYYHLWPLLVCVL